MALHIDDELREAYRNWGKAICDGCDETIVFEDDDSFDEARETVNEHMRTEHDL